MDLQPADTRFALLRPNGKQADATRRHGSGNAGDDGDAMSGGNFRFCVKQR